MTPAPDFRALCAELVDELNYHADEHSVDELIARARAALATPPAWRRRRMMSWMSCHGTGTAKQDQRGGKLTLIEHLPAPRLRGGENDH